MDWVAILMLGKMESRRRRGQQRTRLLNGITNSMDMSLSKLWEMVKDRCAAVHEAVKSHTWLSNWTTTPGICKYQIRSVAQSCPTICDPMNHSTPGLPAHHQLPEFTQTHVHRVSDATQPSHPLSSPSPPASNPSQHQSRTIKQTEHQIINIFELWCWRRLLRVPWTARRWIQSILKEISPEY